MFIGDKTFSYRNILYMASSIKGFISSGFAVGLRSIQIGLTMNAITHT